MRLFEGISPNNGETTLLDGYRTLLRQAERIRQGGVVLPGDGVPVSHRWSLAELGADDDDLIWLIDWARSLDGWLVHQWLYPGPNRNALGSLLLLFGSEYTRRSLPTDCNWLVPTPQLFSADSREYLFQNDVPTVLYRLALLNAANRLDLQRVTGTDWLSISRTVRLQYGFAENDLIHELPDWLSGKGRPSEAVSQLLDEINGRPSFRIIWEACRAGLESRVDSQVLREQLEASPWILRQWHPQILRLLTKPGETESDDLLELPPLPAVLYQDDTGLDEILALMELDEDLMTEARGLFARLDADGGWASAMEAVQAINHRAIEMGLVGRPWSLAELQIDPEADYRWLTDWITKVEARTLDKCLTSREVVEIVGGPGPCAAGFGLLLLLWMSETGRRLAGEFTLWNSLNQELKGCREENGQSEPIVFQELDEIHPTSSVRLALRAAASHFQLRNLSGVDWFDSLEQTVRLQFGFTREGLDRQLPDWLSSRATTRVIRELLHGEQRSESFAEIWQALIDYRQGRLPREQLRERLNDTPWVLPGWVDEILPLATAIGDPLPVDERVQAPGEFLSTPYIVWHRGGKPHFITRLIGELTAVNNANPGSSDAVQRDGRPQMPELTDDSLELRIGGRLEAILLRQPDGRYIPDRHGLIRLPFNQPRVRANLINGYGENVRTMILNLWPPDDEVALYDLSTGRQIPDPFCAELNLQRDYALLTSTDLRIEPDPADWRLSRSGTTRISYISAESLLDNPNGLRVYASSNLFWYPGCQRVVPSWSGKIDVVMAREQILQQGDSFHLQIIHPPELEILTVRRNRRTLETMWKQDGVTLIRPQFVVTNNVIEIKLLITALKNDHQYTVERVVVLSGGRLECFYDDQSTRIREQSYMLVGASEIEPTGSRALPLTLGQLNRAAHGSTIRQDEALPAPALNIPSRKPESGLGGIGQLFLPGGLGSRSDQLRLKDDIEDVIWENDSESLTHSGSAFESKWMRIRLARFIEPDSSHKIVVWDRSGALFTTKPEGYEHTDGYWWWLARLPNDFRTATAVAIALNNRNVASWWSPGDWTSHLREVVEADPYTSAWLLRWFHLPLLSEEAVTILRPLVCNNPLPIIRAWLKEDTGSGSLNLPFRDETWLGIVRDYLIHWQPEESEARELLMLLVNVDSDPDLREYIFDAVQPLYRVDPVMMIRVLRAWNIPNREAILIELRRGFAGVVNVNLINARENALIARAHQLFGVDSSFIIDEILLPARQYLAGLPLNREQLANLEMAARSDELRRLLAIHLLK